MSLFPLGLLSQGGGATGASNPSLELISTTVTTGSTSTLTFSSLPTGYKHLQIRYLMLGPSFSALYLRFNGSSAFTYSWHLLRGNGSNVQSSYTGTNRIELSGNAGLGDPTNPLSGVCDILDAFGTAKRKNVKNLFGTHRGSWYEVGLSSGGWDNSSAITSLTLSNDSGNFASGSRFSLYGIKES